MTAWFSFVSVVVIAACACAQTEEPAAIVVRPPADFAATAGQTVRLTCVAYGYPVPSITWTASSQSLDLTDKVSEETVTVNETTFRVSVLQLCDITSANEAGYRCTASNEASGTGIASNSATTLLSVSQPVIEPPSIVVRPPEMNTVDVDDTIEIICVAYGNPIPTITWSRPGCFDLNDTSETTNIKIYSEMVTSDNTTFQKSVMQICAIKPEDSNLYTCTAKNGVPGAGLASPSASFQVRVNGGESSAFPTPTDMIGVADTSSFIQDSWAMIIMAAEGVVILVLLLVLLVVVVWACRIKKAKIKSVALIRKADEDDYTLPPGTSAELKRKEAEEGDYAAVDEVVKSYPVSSNPAFIKSSLPPMIHMNVEYENPKLTEEEGTYVPMDGGK